MSLAMMATLLAKLNDNKIKFVTLQYVHKTADFVHKGAAAQKTPQGLVVVRHIYFFPSFVSGTDVKNLQCYIRLIHSNKIFLQFHHFRHLPIF